MLCVVLCQQLTAQGQEMETRICKSQVPTSHSLDLRVGCRTSPALGKGACSCRVCVCVCFLQNLQDWVLGSEGLFSSACSVWE